MSRHSVQTVTGLPALIPCQIGEEDGFLGSTPLRVITAKLIFDAVRKRTKPHGLTAAAWKNILGLKLLLRAHELRDLKAAKAASQLLMQDYQFNLDPSVPQADYRKETAGYLSEDTIQDAGFMASLISSAVSGARPGLWQPGKWKKTRVKLDNPFRALWVGNARGVTEVEAPQRGMLCADMETAVAYKMLFNGIRICLRCHSIFSGKPNQDYCSVQCRESHRVARWRERKAQQGKQKGK